MKGSKANLVPVDMSTVRMLLVEHSYSTRVGVRPLAMANTSPSGSQRKLITSLRMRTKDSVRSADQIRVIGTGQIRVGHGRVSESGTGILVSNPRKMKRKW